MKRKVIPIKNTSELSKFLRPMYVIEDYMVSNENYIRFQEDIYNIIKGCFHIKECREYPVKFRFYKSDKTTHELQFRHFIVNVFAWYPFVNLYGIENVLDESFIIDCFNDIPHITDYINEKIIITLRKYSIRNTVLNTFVSEVLYNLRRISTDFSLILNLTLSASTFINAYKDNARLREIMNTEFSNDMQPYEIEQEMNKLQAEEIEIFKSMKDNPVGVILRAGTGIKHKQLAEFTIAMSLKPDLNGVTIPLPISSSTLINGLNKPSYHYLDSLGARKSLNLISLWGSINSFNCWDILCCA